MKPFCELFPAGIHRVAHLTMIETGDNSPTLAKRFERNALLRRF